MPQNLSFDTGVKEFVINGNATLRFNPADMAIFNKLVEFIEKMDTLLGKNEKLQSALDVAMENTPEDEEAVDEDGFPLGSIALLEAVKEQDDHIKESLQEVFGYDNDFDAIFDHRNALALSGSGVTILENFIEAIADVMVADTGERSDKAKKLQEARVLAAKNREQRRSEQYGRR